MVLSMPKMELWMENTKIVHSVHEKGIGTALFIVYMRQILKKYDGTWEWYIKYVQNTFQFVHEKSGLHFFTTF